MATKSFEFKIGADTSDFVKKMNSADKAVDKFDKQAQKLEKGLSIKFDDSRFLQSQKLVQQALKQTEANADACRRELKFLEDAGQVDTKAYEDIQYQLAQAENKAVLLQQRLKELNNLKFTTLGNNLKKAGQQISSFANTLKGVSVASGAVVAGLAKVATETIKTGDEIATLASKYNLSAKEIQKWQYVAMQSDVSDTSLYKGLVKVNSALADMAKGEVSNATKAISELGLDASSSFDKIISKLSQLTDANEKLYYANQIFGDKLGADIIPLLNQGADAVSGYIKEFEDVGYLSDEAVEKLSKLDNVLNKVKTQFKEIMLSLGESLMPILETFVKYVEDNVIPKVKSLVDKFANMSDSSKELTAKILILIPVITALSASIGKVLVTVGQMIASLPQLANMLSALESHPIIAIIGVIAILLTVLYTKNENFRESVNRLLGILGKSAMPILNKLSDSLQDILGLLEPILEIVGNDLAKAINYTCELLEPLVDIVSFLVDGISRINDFLMTPLGRGWLWGTEEEGSSSAQTSSSYELPKTEYPTITYPSNATDNSSVINNDNTSVVNNITIEANEYTTAEEVARVLSLKLQSRG